MEEAIRKWMEDWVKRTSTISFENSFNEKSDEWREIEGVGKFKGLKIEKIDCENPLNISINLTFDKFEKPNENAG